MRSRLFSALGMDVPEPEQAAEPEPGLAASAEAPVGEPATRPAPPLTPGQGTLGPSGPVPEVGEAQRGREAPPRPAGRPLVSSGLPAAPSQAPVPPGEPGAAPLRPTRPPALADRLPRGPGGAMAAPTGAPAPAAPRPTSAPARSASAPARSASAPARPDLAAPPPTSAAQGTPAPPTAPWSESSRRFLSPLVGVDPATVSVHRGAEAERLTAVHSADAVTVGNQVVIGTGQSEESPELLGLLAHELTHVARGRDRRFVPPIARGPVAAEAAHPGALPPVPTEPALDEEALARRVEARVTRAAQAARDEAEPHAAQPHPVEPPRAGSIPPDRGGSAARSGPAPAGWGAAAPAPGSPAVPDPESEWNGLPPPWAPLTAWPGTEEGPDLSPAQPAFAAAPASGIPEPAEATAVIQAAEQGRTLPQEGAAGPGPGQEGGGVEPDLDNLARQVYAVLRRRLATERRRLG